MGPAPELKERQEHYENAADDILRMPMPDPDKIAESITMAETVKIRRVIAAVLVVVFLAVLLLQSVGHYRLNTIGEIAVVAAIILSFGRALE